MTDNSSSYWLNILTKRVLERKGKNASFVVSSGISPSGPYHVGHAREILMGEALKRSLELAGKKVQHLHFVDAHDALRKKYPYLPQEYEQEIGKPYYLVKAPDDKSKSYGEQFFKEYFEASKMLGIEMEVLWTNQEYQNGKFAELIVKALENRDKIAKILLEISSREVEKDWQPIQILDSATQKLNTAKYISFDAKNQTVTYLSKDGTEKVADMKNGEIKLDWRVDWPARWAIYGVDVEGFGREHATKGGSYDTGKAIAEQIFGIEAPVPVPFDTISLKGDNKKMSSSLGNLITIQGALEIIPPEILRYFVFKSRPEKQLSFDPSVGLYNLVEEFAKVEEEVKMGKQNEFKDAFNVSVMDKKNTSVTVIPFSHLVTTFQAGIGNRERILGLLEKTHKKVVQNEKTALERELGYVERWLETQAPENVKFTVQEKLPKVLLEKNIKEWLKEVENQLGKLEYRGGVIHNMIYNTAKDRGISPKQAFGTIYQIFLNKTSGPKVGWFLEILDKKFVLSRIKEASNS